MYDFENIIARLKSDKKYNIDIFIQHKTKIVNV
jgi:hypothetical protein